MAGELAEKLSKMKMPAPTLHVSATVDSYGAPVEDKSYLKERHARLKKAIKVAEDQIKNWDPEAVAAQALKSLKADLARSRAELLVCEAEMGDGADDEDDADTIEEGNPYKVVKAGDKFKVVGIDSGKVHGTFDSRAKALRQFRLLEMKYHEEK